MAGASKEEYADIAPRLAAQSFDVIAIDQRSGGGANQTVAALAVLLAPKHPGDVAAVLAIWPGEYIAGQSMRGAAARIGIPVFMTSSNSVVEITAAKNIADAVPPGSATHFAPQFGAHASSTLKASAHAQGFDGIWMAVESFLKRAAP